MIFSSSKLELLLLIVWKWLACIPLSIIIFCRRVAPVYIIQNALPRLQSRQPISLGLFIPSILPKCLCFLRRFARDNFHNPNRGRPSDPQIRTDRYLDKFMDKIDSLEKQEIDREQKICAIQSRVRMSSTPPPEHRGQQRPHASEPEGIVTFSSFATIICAMSEKLIHVSQKRQPHHCPRSTDIPS